MADMMYGQAAAAATLGGGDLADDGGAQEYYNGGAYGGTNMTNNNAQPRQRFPGLYVGNLTWWTTDRDVIDAICSIGVTDVQEVKFFENRNNGQSKGFCLVTFGSEASLPIVLEKLPDKELHGQIPLVTQYNRQNLNILEMHNKPRPQINSSNGPVVQHAAGIMGINSISGVHAATNAQAAAVAAVAGMPYAGLNAVGAGGGFNQVATGALNPLGGAVGPRNPTFHPQIRMGMRGPRGMIRGTQPGPMNNGPMMPGGHQMNRMRFMQQQQQNWNNSQGAYNPAANRMGPQVSLDISNRLGGMKPSGGLDDQGQDMISSSGGGGGGSSSGTQSYYPPAHHHQHHQSNSQDHYTTRGDIHNRDNRDYHHSSRDLRDERDIGRRLEDRSERGSRLDDSSRSSRLDDSRSSRLDDSRSLHHRSSLAIDDGRSSDRDRDASGRHSSTKYDDRSERSRRDERSSRKDDDRSSSRRERTSDIEKSRRSDRSDERSSRREDKTTASSSSSSRHRESRSHRSSERATGSNAARSRSRSRDRGSREGKERRDRDRERGSGREKY